MPIRALPAFLVALSLAASHGACAQSPFETRGTGLPIVKSSVLPVDEAFALNTFIEAPDTVVVMWDIREGYYLYQKSLAILDADDKSVDPGELPASIMLSDEFFGDVEVYYDSLVLRFPLSRLRKTGHAWPMTLRYQGCAEDLYCYPPQERQVTLTLPETGDRRQEAGPAR